MRTILDGPSRRLIHLLEYLDSSDEWLTMGNIAKKLMCSEKTVQEDLNYVRDRWGSLLEIEASFVYGIRLNPVPTSVLSLIFSEIFEESIGARWLQLVFFQPYHDLEFYAKKLHVSSSTLYRLSKKINGFLSEFKIKVTRKRSLFYMEGQSEVLVRKFMTTQLLEVSGHYLLKIIDDNWLSYLQKHVREVVLKEYTYVSNLQVYYFVVFYYVSLSRENQAIALANYPARRQVDTEELLFFQQKFPLIKSKAINNIEGSMLAFKAGWKDSVEQEHVQQVIREFVNQLFMDLHIQGTVREKDKIQDILEDMYFGQQNGGAVFATLFDRFKYFSATVKSEKTNLYRYLTEQLNQLSKLLACDLTKNLDELTYWVVTTLPESLMFSMPQNILIVSDISLEHAYFLKDFIKKSFSLGLESALNFDCTSRSEFLRYHVEDYRLVISNCLLPPILREVVIVDDFPSYKNFGEVLHQLNR